MDTCKECVEKKVRVGTPLECMICYLWKPLRAFSEAQRDPHRTVHRKCVDCEERRKCCECGEAKIEDLSAQAQAGVSYLTGIGT